MGWLGSTVYLVECHHNPPQYVFTEWDPTAKGDLEAVRNVWDTNGDGKLTAADADFAKFKLLVTQGDGSQVVQTLTQAGITEINLKADATSIHYADGSAITGQTTFTRSNATTGSVANMLLATEATGHAVTTATSTDVNGNRVVINTAYGLDASIAHITKSVTSTNGQAFASVDEKADVKKSRMEPIRAKAANDNMCKLQFAA